VHRAAHFGIFEHCGISIFFLVFLLDKIGELGFVHEKSSEIEISAKSKLLAAAAS
jgi:hypothetical protein